MEQDLVYPPGHGLKRFAIPPDPKLPCVAECDCGKLISGENAEITSQLMRSHCEQVINQQRENVSDWLERRSSLARDLLGGRLKEDNDPYWVPEPFETRPH